MLWLLAKCALIVSVLASTRCQECGPLGYFCFGCFKESYSVVNLFHVAEKWEICWNDILYMYTPITTVVFSFRMTSMYHLLLMIVTLMFDLIRESVDSLCRDSTDTTRPLFQTEWLRTPKRGSYKPF